MILIGRSAPTRADHAAAPLRRRSAGRRRPRRQNSRNSSSSLTRDDGAAPLRIDHPVVPAGAAREVVAVERRRAEVGRDLAAAVNTAGSSVAKPLIAQRQRAAHEAAARRRSRRDIARASVSRRAAAFSLETVDAVRRLLEPVDLPAEADGDVGPRARVLEQERLDDTSGWRAGAARASGRSAARATTARACRPPTAGGGARAPSRSGWCSSSRRSAD